MDSVLQTLLGNYEKFRQGAVSGEEAFLVSLGQKPSSLLISCCDSRVDPSLIFGLSPGEMLSIRNVANLIPPCEEDQGHHGVSAALEFGISVLKVRHLIVLGHSQCGGVTQLLEGDTWSVKEHPLKFVSPWVDLLSSIRSYSEKHFEGYTPHQRLSLCSQMGVLLSLRNVLTFPDIVERLHEGHLFLHGWFFDIPRQMLFFYHEGQRKFVPFSQDLRPLSHTKISPHFPFENTDLAPLDVPS